MAARRLIIILVLLLAASVVAAALAPDRSGRIAGTASTTTTTTAADPGPSTESLSVRIDAAAGKPETVEGFAGDQLELSVGSDPARTIAIEPLGLAEFAGPDAPAHFDLLLREPGAIPITDADSGAIVGRLVISDRDEAPGSGRPGRGTEASRAARRDA